MTNDSNAAFVLHNSTPSDVARAMIVSGKQKEPFYLFNMDEAYRRIVHFRKMMPRVQIFYAMKANDYEMMLKTAISLGLGFNCASPGEIHKALQLNINPKSIIFGSPTKTPEQMKFARDSAVSHTTFDSLYELKKIKQYWPDARLLIRIRVESEYTSKLGEKIGCGAGSEAEELLEAAAALNLRVIGVAFHVDRACWSIDSHILALKHVKALFDHEAKAGRRMSIVDIGGGFLGDSANRIDQVSKNINTALKEYFPDPDIQVIAEPGRYICDSSFNLYSNINNIRRVKKGNKMVDMIYINDGLYGTLRHNEPWHTVEKFEIQISNANKEDENLESPILWGPSGDSTDRVMENYSIRLPKCTPFDWLVFRSHGAYSFSLATDFSYLPKPLIRTVVSEYLWNKIKNSMVFNPTDFVEDPDLATPLLSTIPQVIPRKTTYVPQVTLKV